MKEKNFSDLSDLKKAELNQLYIEGLLLETETDEAKLLNELFNLVKNDQVRKSLNLNDNKKNF